MKLGLCRERTLQIIEVGNLDQRAIDTLTCLYDVAEFTQLFARNKGIKEILLPSDIEKTEYTTQEGEVYYRNDINTYPTTTSFIRAIVGNEKLYVYTGALKVYENGEMFYVEPKYKFRRCNSCQEIFYEGDVELSNVSGNRYCPECTVTDSVQQFILDAIMVAPNRRATEAEKLGHFISLADKVKDMPLTEESKAKFNNWMIKEAKEIEKYLQEEDKGNE